MKTPMSDTGFVHDFARLDRLRSGLDNDSESLKAATQQFEGLFMKMLFQSMREANSAFKSDLLNSQTEEFYQQIYDDQLVSELSSQHSLGLADAIVQQLRGESSHKAESGVITEMKKKTDVFSMPLHGINEKRPQQDSSTKINALTELSMIDSVTNPNQKTTLSLSSSSTVTFDSAVEFMTTLKPLAKKAADTLEVDPAILIAQAALETGWGKKVIQNSAQSSHNLFNIKVDKRWEGDQMRTNTLEFHDGVAVKEKAAFRSYDSYDASFMDFVNFLQQNPRYKTALTQTHNSERFMESLHQAGYATDPKYSDKVLQIYRQIQRADEPASSKNI